MGRQSNEEKRAFWRMVVQMQEESGLSVRRFCEQEGLGQASFFAWRRKLRQETTGAQGGGPGPRKDGKESPRLVPVRLLDEKGAAGVEIACPGGMVLRVHDEASTENVRRVLQLMHEFG